MARNNFADNLLGATDPGDLKHIVIGTFLSFFVFLGSFFTTSSALDVFIGEENILLAASYVTCNGGICSAQPDPNPQITEPKNPYTAPLLDYDGDGDIDSADKMMQKIQQEYMDSLWRGEQQYKQNGGGGGTKSPAQQNQPVQGGEASLGDYNCLSATGC